MKANLNFTKAMGTLKKEMSGKPAARPAEVSTLYQASIFTMIAVFQPRSLEGNIEADEAFIHELVTALKQGRNRPLDAITVWWSGKHWYVIDGHHRLETD